MSRIFDIFKKAIVVVYLAVFCVLTIDLLILEPFLERYYSKDFALPNVMLLLIGLAIVGLIAFFVMRFYKNIQPIADRFINRISIGVLAVLLLVLQMYIAKNIYFITSWDPGIIVNAANAIANGTGEDISWYYNMFPNNIFITYLYAIIIRFNGVFNLFEDYYFALIAVQCLLSAITAYLVYTVTYEFTKNKLISLFSFAVYTIFIGLSPWFVIPYSDATGILFPILLIRLYQMTRNDRVIWQKLILWAIIGVVSFIGLRIKPQIFIVFIAIIIVELIEILFKQIKNKKQLLTSLSQIVVCGAVLFVSMFSFSQFLKSQEIITDPEKEISTPHFIMMGLNDYSNGAYLHSDFEYSRDLPHKEARVEGNIKVIKERIKEYGVSGLAVHLLKKNLVNFGDGTFCWPLDGDFFMKILPEPNETISPILRSFYYENGENFGVFNTYMQCIWLTVFALGAITAIFAWKKKEYNTDVMSVLLLSVVGLTFFECLFEARARYLFTYAPLFIICACIGMYILCKVIKDKNKI